MLEQVEATSAASKDGNAIPVVIVVVVPIAYHGQIPTWSVAKQDCVVDTRGIRGIAVAQIPGAGRRPKDANRIVAIAIPVARDGDITGLPK